MFALAEGDIVLCQASNDLALILIVEDLFEFIERDNVVVHLRNNFQRAAGADNTCLHHMGVDLGGADVGVA